MSSFDYSVIAERAKEILRQNTITVHLNGKAYQRIIPSRDFYVHQWNWDSATHAMGLVCVDEKLAFAEIRSLISGQWQNGLIPQITFNPNETKYFPGPQFWGTEAFATGEIITSGITQPPLVAVAVEAVYRQAKDREKARMFLAEVLPQIERYHDYLKTYRDPENEGLLTIIHPWESGTDNSPRFDDALEQIPLTSIPDSVEETVNRFRTDDRAGLAAHRPRLHDYYRYLYLVSLFKRWRWDYQKIVAESPFAVKDVLFTSIWARANSALASLEREVGNEEKAQQYEDWTAQTITALRQQWDEKYCLFTDMNVARGRRIPIFENTIAALSPLYAAAVPESVLPNILEELTDKMEYSTPFPVPSTAFANPHFDPERYWRGSTWPITNLFIIDGLTHYQPESAQLLSRTLREKTLQLIAEQGFFEYYHPVTGAGLGFSSFSWTAAIFLILFTDER